MARAANTNSTRRRMIWHEWTMAISGKKGPWQDVLARDHKPRHSTRRFGTRPVPHDPTPTFAVSSDQLPPLEQIELFSAVALAPPDLAGCWQFYWRTALEPRAPSSVS